MEQLQKIQKEREAIARIGSKLGKEKERYLEEFRPIPIHFTIKVLHLVQIIAQYDIKYRANFGTEQRKFNLGNLALTVKLLDNSAGLAKHDVAKFYKAPNNLHGYINTNLFDDMKYLCTYDLAVTTSPLIQLRPISDDDIANILDTICPIFSKIAFLEKRALLFPNAAGPDLEDIRETRNLYQDHRKTDTLYFFIQYEKETRKLRRASKAIEETQDMAVDHDSPLKNKRAFLKSLVVVGEAFTQSNLTAQSRRLLNIAQQDLQLFKNLRNKIADSQYDLRPELVEAYISQNSLEDIKAELNNLLPKLIEITTQLETKRQNNELMVHYRENAPALADQNNHNFFTNTRTFLNALPINKRTYIRDKTDHPNDFTLVNIVQKVRKEINEIITLTNDIPGKDTLNDPRSSDKQRIFGCNADELLKYIALANGNNDELNYAINTIRNLSPQVLNKLSIEFSTHILAPPFRAQEYPDGYIRRFNDVLNQMPKEASVSEIKQYAKKLKFINHLNTNTICKNAIEYHFGRITRFLMEISRDAFERYLSYDNLVQWRCIRNVIQHDLEELTTYGVTVSDWLQQSLGTITRDLPSLLLRVPIALPAP